MGSGFTIDSAMHVARYGISSAMSLVDDTLIEGMRKYHCEHAGEPYEAITAKSEDARARRMTAYLNLLDRLVARQVEELRASPFEPGSEITRYHEMLPDSPGKHAYREMLANDDPKEKAWLQSELRRQVVPGTIDVNIMSKGDRELYCDGQKLPAKFTEASAALRGFANSTLRSSIILSAGFNPRLYGYLAKFDDFFPDENGELKKKIVLKVSDYRSAVIQGKFLAKRGLWVSEYRIESGLNCGGHAFATKGLLMGPILEEFKQRRDELIEKLHAVYKRALAGAGRMPIELPMPVRITAQGGIGTAEEDRFLMEHYELDATGWATPFLFVPEVTNVDDVTLDKLLAASSDDDNVFLSDSSPFGLPFWNLRNSGSEEARRARIAKGRPGSACFKGHCMLYNVEFTDVPICTASRQYQKLKLAELAELDLPEEQRKAIEEAALGKSCICNDLGGGAAIKHGINPDATPAICCGPGTVDFSRIASLEEMVDHIYGRASLLTNDDRPHMFIREFSIYLDHLRSEIKKCEQGLISLAPDYVQEFKANLLDGVEYYRRLADEFDAPQRTSFLAALEKLHATIEPLSCTVAE